MANYFVSYDLNGKTPTHAEMDAHLKKLGPCILRVLETVWYVRYNNTLEQLYAYVNSIVSANDGVLVILANRTISKKMLVPDSTYLNCWEK